jgi:hypothetical protein
MPGWARSFVSSWTELMAMINAKNPEFKSM